MRFDFHRAMLLDPDTHPLRYLPGAAIVLSLMYLASRGLRGDRQWRCVFWVSGIIGAASSMVMVAAGIPQATKHDWSAARLAPAAAWIRGYELYYPHNQGPMLVQMYGPVSAMLYVPAALASRPTPAILIGVFTGLASYALPAAWFLLWSRRDRGLSIVVISIVAFVLISSSQFVLSEAVTRVTIDAPAVGFSLCAFAMLAGAGQSLHVRALLRLGLWCGVFAAMSIWTKLTLGPVVVAMALYVWMLVGRHRAAMFVLGMAISGAAVSAILLLWFGPAMLFQMLVVPLNQPWQVPELPAPLALWHAVQWLWYWSNPVGWILLAGLVIAIGVSRADPARWREWLDGNPWILPMLGAVCVLPTSAIASAKWGGAWNNAVPGASMALLAAVGALGNAASRGHWDAPNRPGLPPLGRLARVALLGLVLAACWIPVSGFSQLVDGLRTWKRLSDNDHEAAFRYAREHPGEIYFPCHPLSPLLAEGKAYHFQAGLDDLRVAGLAMSEANFRAWLPPRMRAVAFRPRQAQWVRDVLARLPEFRRMVRIPELHEWILLTRDQ